jgi:predicted AlkP superfamily pyrophosphatase or phosphodiesterase
MIKRNKNQFMKFKKIFILTISLLNATLFIHAKPPKLTLVIFIDQLNQQTLNTIKPYLTGGLNYLIDNGLVYQNAHWPFGMPSTAAGHSGFSTGTQPINNGITANSWFSPLGKKISCDDDSAERAAVFAPNGLYKYGKSSCKLMVDTITDQFMMQSDSKHKNGAFTISLKSRAAIMLAGTAGKAIWYDDEGKQFTSSKAYFNELPIWLKEFNTQKPLDKPVWWQTVYPKDHEAYDLIYQNKYNFTREKSLIETEVPLEELTSTPHALQVLFDLTKKCIDNEFDKYDQFYLGVSFSSTDKIGHKFGPNSIEYRDMLYHFDRQLDQFLRYLNQKIQLEQVLIVFTADHGSMPIPELVKAQGFSKAGRINTKTLKKQINQCIQKEFNVPDIVQNINMSDLFLNHQQLDTLPAKKRVALINVIKQFMKKIPGIKDVWTYNELKTTSFTPQAFDYVYKTQLFPERSGDLIFSVFPYVYVSKYKGGTGHKSPYEYDTNIPLILYQKGTLGGRTIYDKVYGCQVATTLSWLLKIPRPSSTTFDALPGIKY